MEAGALMGLDTSHDCWSGAYGAFSRWRDKLAEVAGYEFKLHEGDYSPAPIVDWNTLHADMANGPLMGGWDETPADPLLILIAHSDCDGWIRHAQTGPLADRLEELLPLLPEGEAPGHVRHWRNTTQRFIDGLRLAAANGEDVEFA
jgi:hypothetical protein